MKVLESRCERQPLDDPEVLAVLDQPGYHSVLWKCPQCRARWIARGTTSSKEAKPARWNLLYGWSA